MVHYTFPTHEYNYRVITRGDLILHEYYITEMRNCENIRKCTSMNSKKGTHEFTKGKLERHTGGLEGWALNG